MKVLILPGLDGTGIMLAEFTELIKTRFDVQLVSYPKTVPLTYQELADLVSEILPKNEPYVIVAESFSGPVASRLLSRNPIGLRALVFAASFAKTPTWVPEPVANLVNIFPTKSKLLLRLARPFMFGRWGSRKLDDLLEKAINAVAPDVLAFRIRQVLGVDELSKLKGVDIPMLYLRPTHDRLVSQEAAIAIKNVVPSLEVTEVAGPHFILQAQPKQCADVITKFSETL